jgi:hypothetical protein
VIVTSVRRLAALAVGTAIVLSTAGCAGSDGTASAVEGISIERTTTTDAPTLPPTTTTVAVQLLPSAKVSRPAPPARRSWEGQKYDFGRVLDVEQREDGWVLVFDRSQITDEYGTRTGPTLTEEPVLIGDTEERIENTSSKLRAFGVLPDAVVLRLSPTWSCAQPMPVWDHLDIAQLAQVGSGADTRGALTFDADGQVTQVRLSRGC